MGDLVFISHSSKDQQVVDLLCKCFDSRKISYWICSRDIKAGDDWSESIVKAIEVCSLVVLVYSSHSNASPQVKRELERAVHLNKPIIPFKIDNSPMSKSMQYFISTQHWLDASQPPIKPHLLHLAKIIGKIHSGDPEGQCLIEQFTPRKPYWNTPRIAGLGLVVALLVACTYWVIKSVAQKDRIAAQQATREHELLSEKQQSAKVAEQQAVEASAQTLAHSEFAEARKVRMEGDQLVEGGKSSEGRVRLATTAERFEEATRIAQQREKVSQAKSAFLEELSSHSPDLYDKDSKEWQDLVIAVGQAEELSRSDKHEQAIEAFHRAREAALTAIPIHRSLKDSTNVELVDVSAIDAIEFLRDMSNLRQGTFVFSADAKRAIDDAVVNVAAEGVSMEDVLRRILKQSRRDLDFVIQDDRSIFIHTSDDKAEAKVNGEPGKPAKKRFALPPWEQWFGLKQQGLAYLTREKTEEAIRVLNQAIEADRQDFEPYGLLASAYRQASQSQLALETWTKRIALTPKDPVGYFSRGCLHFEMGNQDLAIDDLSEAIRLDPKDERKFIWRGDCWLMLAQYDKAVVDFSQAITRSPENSYSYAGRAFASLRMNKTERALADYNKAIQLSPNVAHYFFNRASVWVELKEYEKSVVDLRTAVKLDGKHVPAVNALAWILATCPKNSVRNAAQAVQYATLANELTEWNDPIYMDTLAAAYAEAREFDKAVTWQSKASELAPQEAKADFESRIAIYKSQKPFRDE